MMQDFCVWFLQELPAFLMAEPIVYFVGLFFSFFIIKLIGNIFGLGKSFRF